MQVIVLWSEDSPALTLDVRAVSGPYEACMAYGAQLAKEMEKDGATDVVYVLCEAATPAVQCFTAEPQA